uniref:Condensin complex subunit 1 C-terminal domain-containing protein n=1 Tax=Parascaris univalens TaxID=6257 RepID=A0A915ASM5_PARUN
MDQNDDVEVVENGADVRLGGFHEMLAEALAPGKEQKKLIRKLSLMRDELLEECSVGELCRAIKEPTFITSLEGRKLAVSFTSKIGIEKVWKIVVHIIGNPQVDRELCKRYGEVLFWAWRKAEEPERQKVVEVLQNVVFYALCGEGTIAGNFLAALEPVRKGTCKQIEDLVFQIMLPNMWRALKARNAKVRINAVILLGNFYPIVNSDSCQSDEFGSRQRSALLELLMDGSYAVRIEACKAAMSILGSFWVTFDPAYIRQILSTVVDRLSRDTIVAVRVAVYKSLSFLLPCPSAINAVEVALKCVIPRGVNDCSEKVRVAAFELLNALRGHRFIHFWNVIEMNEILDCFEVEEAESVKKQMTKLLLRSFKPSEVHPDEGIRRILYLGNRTRLGALAFHHLMISMKLITVDEALEHVQMLAIAIYKALRISENAQKALTTSLNESSTVVSAKALNDAVVVDPDEGDESEGAKQWRSCMLLLDCIVVTWIPLRTQLLNINVECVHTLTERKRTTNILSKLFSLLFDSFKNSSMFDSIMALGSTLSEQRQVSAVVMRELFSDKLVNTPQLPSYLEVAASWDFPKVLNFMHSGLQLIGSGSEKKQQKKKCKDAECSIKQALEYLKEILRSPIMEQNLISNHRVYLEILHNDLLAVNGVIEAMLDKDPAECLKCTEHMDTKDVLTAFESQHALSMIILASAKNNESHCRLEEVVESDATYFLEKIMPRLAMATDTPEWNFLVELCQLILRMSSYHLESYSHSARYKKVVADCIAVLTTKNTPSVFIVPVLKTLKNLCRALDEVEDKELMEGMVVPLTRSCLIWMSDRVEDGDFNMKESAESFLRMVNALKMMKKLSRDVLDMYAKVIIATTIPALLKVNKDELEVVDPRAHSFDAPPIVRLLIWKILHKNGSILVATEDLLSSMITSKVLVGAYDTSDTLYVYGAIVQLVLLIKNNKNQPSSVIVACIDKLRNQMEELAQSLKMDQLYGHIMEMCHF